MIEINYIEDQNIVYVVTKGQFDINDVKQFLKDSAQLAHEKGCHKVLLDHRDSPFIANIFEVYSVARNVQSFGFDIDLRGAVIYNRDQENMFSQIRYPRIGHLEFCASSTPSIEEMIG